MYNTSGCGHCGITQPLSTSYIMNCVVNLVNCHVSATRLGEYHKPVLKQSKVSAKIIMDSGTVPDICKLQSKGTFVNHNGLNGVCN